MYVEKIVCDNLFGALLNIQGKIKYGKKVRLDMAEMGIRQELAQEKMGKRRHLPPACHTLSRKEKKEVFAIVYMISNSLY